MLIVLTVAPLPAMLPCSVFKGFGAIGKALQGQRAKIYAGGEKDALARLSDFPDTVPKLWLTILNVSLFA
jgi:hypothetical protein